MRFELTEQHIKLLRRMYVSADIRRIVCLDLSDREAAALHEQTETALQIVLCCGTFEPGTYEQVWGDDSRSWRRVAT